MPLLKRLPMTAGLLAVALFVASCGGNQAAPPSSPAPPKPAASAPASATSGGIAAAVGSAAATPAASGKPAASGQVTKLKLPYTSPSAVYTPHWVGVEQGIFLKHGLDVTVPYLETNAVSPALLAGEIDISPTPSLLNIIVSGGDAVFIVNLVSAPVFSLYATSGIDSVKALKDKVIGDTPQGSAPDGALRALLSKNGLNPGSDVKYIFSPDPSTIVAAMKSNQAAAGILSAPSTVLAKQAGFKELASTGKEGVPGLHSVLGVRKSTLAEKRQTYVALVEAFREATAFAKANPEPTKAIIGKYTKTESGPALDEAYTAFQPYWEVGPVNPSDVMAALQFSSNPAAANFNAASAIDNSVIQAVK